MGEIIATIILAGIFGAIVAMMMNDAIQILIGE